MTTKLTGQETDSAKQEDLRKAQLVRGFLAVVVSVPAVHALALLIFAPQRTSRLWLDCSLLAIAAISFLFLRAGRPRLAGLILITPSMAALTLASVAGSGVRAPAYAAFIIPILFASLLFGARWGIVTAVAAAAIGLGLVYGEASGLLPLAAGTLAAGLHWIGAVIVFGFSAGLVGTAIRQREKALERSRRNALALAEKNQQLEDEIARHEKTGLERDQAETSLRQSEERFRRLSESTLEGVMIHENGIIVDANQSLCELSGYGWAELIGMNGLEIVAPEDRPAILKNIQTGYEAEFEVTVVRKDGTRVPVETQGKAIPYHGETARVVALRDITDRKKAADALRQSEQLLSSIINNTAAIIYVKSIDGRYILVNRHFEDLFGVSLADARGKTDHDVLPKETADQFRANDRRAIEARSIVEIEETVPRADGLHTYISMKFPLFNAGGEVYAVCGISTDITRRKRGEEQLRLTLDELLLLNRVAVTGAEAVEEEALINRVTEAVREKLFPDNCGIYLLREDGKLYPATSFHKHRENSSLFPIPAGKGVTGGVAAAGAPRRIHDVTKDPDYIEVDPEMRSEICVPLMVGNRVIGVIDAESKEIGAFTQNHEHLLVTLASQVATAIERLRKAKAAEESQRFIRRIADTIPGILYVVDLGEMRTIFINVTGILGYSGETLRQLGPRGMRAIVHPDDKNRIPKWLSRFASAGEGEIFESEYRVRAANGDWRWLHCWDTLFARSQSGSIQVLGVAQDITDEKQMEEQLRHAQRMESIGMLAGGISHDFNNLLTVINGLAEVAMRRVAAADRVHEYLASILEAGGQARDLTRQLLAFSRKQVFQPRSIDINTVIQDLEKMLRRLIGEDIKMETVLDPRIAAVQADPGQIEQILVNLIVNARDAIEEKSGSTPDKLIAIETSQARLDAAYADDHPGSRVGPHVLIAISDSGAGMTEEVRRKIFEPFFTTKELGRGTGLGLATVYGIIKQNGGSIHVYSEPGRGACFKIYWPVSEDATSPAVGETASEASLRGNETILLVEDHDGVRGFASESLRDYGYSVIEAQDGLEALKLLQEGTARVDLIVTDLIMPRMNGNELAEKVAQLYPATRILFASGYADNYVVESGVVKEGVNYLQKPYSRQDLARTIRELLD